MTEDILQHQFICEYDGDVIYDKQEKERREDLYEKNESGSYMFEIKYKGQAIW